MTIYDIAALAGVSSATVSRVINGSRRVSEATRRRVLDIMAAEGFTPNLYARGLTRRSFRMAGLLCADAADHFYAAAIAYLERALDARGFQALLCCAGPEADVFRRKLDTLLEKRVDTIVLIGSVYEDDALLPLIHSAAEKVPVLIINGHIPGANCYSLLCDEATAAAEAVRLFRAAGYDNVRFLSGNATRSTLRKRDGYLRAYREAGDTAPDGIDLFDAILASDDLLAMRAQKELAVKKRAVPVIGFDNSLLAECASPALTSVDNRLADMCDAAAGLLLRLQNGETPDALTMFTPCIVERESFVYKNLGGYAPPNPAQGDISP